VESLSDGWDRYRIRSEGELTPVAKPNAVRRGEAFYSVNPFGLNGEPNTKINLFSHLTPSDPNLVSKTKLMCQALIPKTGGAEKNAYFTDRAIEYCEAFVRFDLEQNGRTSVTRLYQLVNAIEGNELKASSLLRGMARSDDDLIRRVGGEIAHKLNHVPKELSAILGTIYQALAPLSDPRVAETFDLDADLDVAALLDGSGRKSKLTFIVPAQNIETMRSIMSMFFVQIESIKADYPGGGPVTLVIDEAGQLRGFSALLRFYTYGRGSRLRTWAFFQSVQQIDLNLGNGASDIILTQSEAIQLFGLNDDRSAERFSRMLGSQTLEFNDPAKQREAQIRAQEIWREYKSGRRDPYSTRRMIEMLKRQSKQKTKQSRRLLDAAEIIRLPDTRQVVLRRGKKPIIGELKPYFSHQMMAGQFGPNPYHPPTDRVTMRTRFFGKRKRKIISEPVPPKFGHLPQYSAGSWSFVKGYRPT
jgi:type IV secretion system protein VirD4